MWLGQRPDFNCGRKVVPPHDPQISPSQSPSVPGSGLVLCALEWFSAHTRAKNLPPTWPLPPPLSAHRACDVIGYIPETVYGDLTMYITSTVYYKNKVISVNRRGFGV